MARRGFTLVELLVGTALLVGGSGALLLGMQQSAIHAEYLSQLQFAVNAAQGQLEALSATAFDTLWSGAEFSAARTGRQTLPLPDLPGRALAVQIRSADIRNPLNPALLNLHVAVCWQSRGRQIGEADCQDGADAEEWVNSPVMVGTRVARRD
jgi:prepilin-type N-terminal cleavage/methylation domain-containing protein